MTSTFFGLEIGRKSLQTQQAALNVTSHNIANANTEGYARQRAVMSTTTPFAYPSVNRPIGAGQIGTGVQVEEIKRMRDDFLDAQFRNENNSTGEWEIRNNTLQKLEVIINEPSDSGLRTVLDQFWQSVQTLSTRPDDYSVRAAVRQRGSAVADTFNQMSQQLQDLQADLDQSVRIKVDEINNIASQVASLNQQIVSIEVSGDNANDLRDKRDSLIDQLSGLVNVDAREDKYGAVTLNVGGRALVINQTVNTMEAVSTPPNGFAAVQWTFDGVPVNITSGGVQGLIYSRDTIAADQLTYLNDMTTSFITYFNFQHQLGYGLDSAPTPPTYIAGAPAVAASVTGTAAPALNYLAAPKDLIIKADNFAPVVIQLDQNYVNDAALAADINAKLVALGYGATASIVAGSLRIESNTMGTSSSIKVTGDAAPLLNLGRIFFSGSDSGDIQVDASIANLDYIAAAGGPLVAGLISPGDNLNALELAKIKHDTTVMGSSSFDDYYRGMAAQLGVDSQAANRMVQNQNLLLSQLDNQKQQVSGVSLDEEMTNMIKFQHAYTAAARVVTTMDEMLDTIVNRLGLTGR